MKRVATVLRSDPMDERDGPLFNSEDRAALNALRPGDRLYVLRQPTPSPDIAGLVGRCTRMLARARETIGNDTQVGLQYRLGEALDALQRVAQERDDYAVIIAGSERLTAVQNSIINSVWDILGRDETRKGGQNLIGRVKELSERAEAAEARLSSARDEGLEMAAKVVGAEYNELTRDAGVHQANGNPSLRKSCVFAARTLTHVEAAIRALKAPTEGTKP